MGKRNFTVDENEENFSSKMPKSSILRLLDTNALEHEKVNINKSEFDEYKEKVDNIFNDLNEYLELLNTDYLGVKSGFNALTKEVQSLKAELNNLKNSNYDFVEKKIIPLYPNSELSIDRQILNNVLKNETYKEFVGKIFVHLFSVEDCYFRSLNTARFKEKGNEKEFDRDKLFEIYKAVEYYFHNEIHLISQTVWVKEVNKKIKSKLKSLNKHFKYLIDNENDNMSKKVANKDPEHLRNYYKYFNCPSLFSKLHDQLFSSSQIANGDKNSSEFALGKKRKRSKESRNRNDDLIYSNKVKKNKKTKNNKCETSELKKLEDFFEDISDDSFQSLSLDFTSDDLQINQLQFRNEKNQPINQLKKSIQKN